MDVLSLRQADHAVDPLFIGRWSPRAFEPVAVSDADLMSLFEAARWAPSSFNSQPWRFIYARRDTPAWDGFLNLLVEFNRSWAKNASALLFAVSKTMMVTPQSPTPVPSASHSFDTGAAWVQLALQASKLGLAAHGMIGFDKDATRQHIALPDEYALEAAIAIGKPGDKSMLSEMLQSRETPSGRNPVSAFAFEGHFSGG
jgi:nitroreductase